MKVIIKESVLREYIKKAITEAIDSRQAAALMGKTKDDYDNNFQFLQKRAHNQFYKGNDAIEGVNAYDAMLNEFAAEMRRINNAIRYIRSHNGMVQQMSADQKAKRAATRKQNSQLRAQYTQKTGAQVPQAGTNYQYMQTQHPDFFKYNRDNGGRSVNNAGQTSTPTNIGGTNDPKRGIFQGLNEGLFGKLKERINSAKIQNTIDACENLIASAKNQMAQEQAIQTINQLKNYYGMFKDWYNQLNNIKNSIMTNSGVVDKNAEDRKTFNQGFKDFKKSLNQNKYKKKA